ncbi:MAG: hypothetical protein OHK0029_21280 [Armatimonadaceae bacterium]
MRRAFLTVFLWFLLLAGALAAPPTIDVQPALSDALQQGSWQPLAVTLQNPDSGTALQGEVQVALEDTNSGVLLGTHTVPVTLPRGAGSVRSLVYVHIPENTQPVVRVYVVSGRGGTGAVITRKQFDKIPVRYDPLTVVAVSQNPSALDFLQAETLGVHRAQGVLLPALAPPQAGSRPASNSGPPQPVRVQSVTEIANLPDRAAGYGATGMVFLGEDIPPGAFGDRQIAALEQWVRGGGALVVEGSGLRNDERFRSWIPVAAGAETARPFFTRRVGRGTVVTANGNWVASGAANTDRAVSLWREMARASTSLPGLGADLLNDSSYYGHSFSSAVMHAPGLQAPGVSVVGMFLLGYILLIAPVNYLILKRLDRREWAWFTIPVLVAVFVGSAYGFGLQTKGTDSLTNTASLIEMNAGSGAAATSGMIGVFSPSRSRYRVALDTPDALLTSTGQLGSSPGYVLEQSATGGQVRDAEIAMWAMRSFSAHTTSLRLGEGLHANLRWVGNPHKGQVLKGTIENRTGKRLKNVMVHIAEYHRPIGTLEAGGTAKVSLPIQKRNTDNPYSSLKNAGDTSSQTRVSPRENRDARSAIISDLVNTLSYTSSRIGNLRPYLKREMLPVIITGWNYEPLLPVRIDGKEPPRGNHVNLVVVSVDADAIPQNSR